MVVNESGQKLSKQTGATRIDHARAPANLVEGLEILGQRPPPELAQGPVSAVWEWTRDHWELERVIQAGQTAIKSYK